MILRIRKQSYKDIFIYMLPTLTIVSQFFSIGTTRISWMLSLLLAVLVLSRINQIQGKNILIVLSIITIIYPIISYIWSFSDSFKMNLYLSFITGVVFFLYIYVIPGEKFKYFIEGCFFSCVLFISWGIYEIFTGNYILFSNPDFVFVLNPAGVHYPGVAFANTNDLAQYIAMVTPIVILYEWKEKGKKTRIFLGAMLIGAVFVIYQSYSHLAMIAFVISLGFVIIRFAMHYLSLIERLLFYSIGMLIVFIIIWNTDIFSLIYNNLMKVGTTNIHYIERATIYLDLLESIVKNPFGGFGNAYAIATTSPHNLFLYIVCDFGIGIGLLFAGLLISLAIKLLKRIDDPVCYGVLTTLLAFPLSSCISSGNEQRKVIWLVLGLAIRCAWKKTYSDNVLSSVRYSNEGGNGVLSSLSTSNKII